MSVRISRIISGVYKIEINNPIFEEECVLRATWKFELKRGLLTVINKTTIDSINDSTVYFEGYVQFEFDKGDIPTLSFLQRISLSVSDRLNEILNSYLQITSLSLDKIPKVDE